MWVRIKNVMILGKQTGKANTVTTTLRAQRAQNGKMISTSKEERKVLVEQYRTRGTLSQRKVDAEFEKGINACAEAKVDATERENSGS